MPRARHWNKTKREKAIYTFFKSGIVNITPLLFQVLKRENNSMPASIL